MPSPVHPLTTAGTDVRPSRGTSAQQTLTQAGSRPRPHACRVTPDEDAEPTPAHRCVPRADADECPIRTRPVRTGFSGPTPHARRTRPGDRVDGRTARSLQGARGCRRPARTGGTPVRGAVAPPAHAAVPSCGHSRRRRMAMRWSTRGLLDPPVRPPRRCSAPGSDAPQRCWSWAGAHVVRGRLGVPPVDDRDRTPDAGSERSRVGERPGAVDVGPGVAGRCGVRCRFR